LVLQQASLGLQVPRPPCDDVIGTAVEESVMSLAVTEKDRIGVEDYLAGERDGKVRHEYVAGQVYAMTGASRRHGLINGALFAALRPGARQRNCQLFTNDMKVYLHHAGGDAFYYPDLVLTCDAEDLEDRYLKQPCLIVEAQTPGHPLSLTRS
jgi:Uma2 family endonuclease